MSISFMNMCLTLLLWCSTFSDTQLFEFVHELRSESNPLPPLIIIRHGWFPFPLPPTSHSLPLHHDNWNSNDIQIVTITYNHHHLTIIWCRKCPNINEKNDNSKNNARAKYANITLDTKSPCWYRTNAAKSNKFCCDTTTVTPRKQPTVNAVENRFRMKVPKIARIKWRTADQYDAICRATDAPVASSFNLRAEQRYETELEYGRWNNNENILNK